MKVVIIEDNKVHLETIKNKLIGVEMKLGVSLEIIVPKNMEEILYINTNNDGVVNIIDIIDQENQEFNGISLAEDIRKLTRSAYIIFMTSYNHYLAAAVNTFVEPLAFISKSDPNLERLLENAFYRILYTASHFKDSVKLQFTDDNGDLLFLSLKEIIYIMTHPTKQKYLLLQTRSKELLVKGRITDYKTAHHNLVLCNKSTLINKDKLKRIKKGTTPKNKIIVLENNKTNTEIEVILSNKFKENLM